MKVFFVMDIMDGDCVAAVRGERSKYRPVAEKSSVVTSSEPLKVLGEIKPRYLYVADLDRIMGKGSNFELISRMKDDVDELIADCGFKHPAELDNLPFKPVVGTETFDITKLNKRCYVSLDFRDEFLDASNKFKNWREAVEFLNTVSLDGVITLTIHAVGTSQPDFAIVERVVELSENPVLIGGGIGSIHHLERAKEIGCSGALIATAVHKKTIPLEIVRKGEFSDI
jgi:phosphoribosylformimino-5-aminoimidazole carboxamide ribotide isomerase